jgi:hypothetical protein
LGRESHQLHEQKIQKIRAALEAPVYVPEKVSTTKHRQFQVRLISAQHTVITWSDADYREKN